MNAFVFLTILCFVPMAFAQIEGVPQSSGPIIVNRPEEKATATKSASEAKVVRKKIRQRTESNSSAKSSTSTGRSATSSVQPGGMGPAIPARAVAPPSQISNEDSLADGEEIVHSVQRGNDAIQRINKRDGYCELCEIQKEQSAGRENNIRSQFKAKEDNSLGEKIPPTQDANNSIGVRSTRCGSRDGGYDVCIYNGDVAPGQIKITSGVPGGKSREWQFNFENKARQDLGFSVTDVSASGRQTNDTYIMVFPRKFLPSIRIQGNSQIVTLPTGETVTYDTGSKKITAGVIDEMKAYNGNGVVVRADQTGSNEARFGKGSSGSATITKQGKSCQVPKKELWPDQTDSSALHFKFATDEDFNAYLTKKCGFGL